MIVGRTEFLISCSVRTLYRKFKQEHFDSFTLPMKGKRKPNRHKEKRGLNEYSNGLLRKDGLPKQMDFNQVDELFIQSIASKRNNIPGKSLNYKTPLEVFLRHIEKDILSSLI